MQLTFSRDQKHRCNLGEIITNWQISKGIKSNVLPGITFIYEGHHYALITKFNEGYGDVPHFGGYSAFNLKAHTVRAIRTDAFAELTNVNVIVNVGEG